MARARLDAHLRMVEKLSTLRQELAYAEKYKGNISCSAYTGMPKGSPTPGRSRTEEEIIAIESLAEKIRQKERQIREDWEELEGYCAKIKPIQALIIKFRYHYGLGWKGVCMQLYGDREDFEIEFKRYQDRMYKIHREGIDALNTKMGRKFYGKQKKVSNPQ